MLEHSELASALPALDADPLSESGVILMGLDARRLLAVLGVATLTAHPSSALLLVDEAAHQGAACIPFDAAVKAGAGQWRMHRPALIAADDGKPRSGAPREAWASAYAHVVWTLDRHAAPTILACLAAAWFRREEINEVVDEQY